jgi:hypothetical protein
MDGIAGDSSAHGDMMAFMTFEDVGIIHGEHFLVGVGDNDGFGALVQALGHTTCMGGAGTFGAAHGVAYRAIDGGIGGYGQRGHEQKRNGETGQQDFSHDILEFSGWAADLCRALDKQIFPNYITVASFSCDTDGLSYFFAELVSGFGGGGGGGAT